MSNQQSKAPSQGKGANTDRQKRLGAALRENLRKRKSQNQDRQKEKDGPRWRLKKYLQKNSQIV